MASRHFANKMVFWSRIYAQGRSSFSKVGVRSISTFGATKIQSESNSLAAWMAVGFAASCTCVSLTFCDEAHQKPAIERSVSKGGIRDPMTMYAKYADGIGGQRQALLVIKQPLCKPLAQKRQIYNKSPPRIA